MADTINAMTQRDVDLAWLAGIFEGEGWVSFHYGSPKHGSFWEAGLKMTDEDVVRRFHRLIGIGQFHGPYSAKPKLDGTPSKLCWTWHIGTREHLLNFCSLLAPMMGERRAAKMNDCLADLVP